MMHALDIIAIIVGTIFLFGAWGCDLGISLHDDELIIYVLIVWWVIPYVFSS